VQVEESAELFGRGPDVGELVSEWKDPVCIATCGVPQRSVLSPLY
jgi:hypothetical protein